MSLLSAFGVNRLFSEDDKKIINILDQSPLEKFWMKRSKIKIPRSTIKLRIDKISI